MKAPQILLIALIPAMASLTACGSWWLPRPHKISIQQGNLLSTEKIEQVKVGMSRGEVVALLGRPITTNQLNKNRWNYIFSLNRSGDKPEVKRLSLDFENDVVAELETDGLEPTGLESK